MRTEHAQFRIRGFHCIKCGDETQVFGNDPAPDKCLSCMSDLTGRLPQYDQVVTTTKTVEKFHADASKPG